MAIANPLLLLYQYQQYPDAAGWFNLYVISDKVTSPSYRVYLPDAPTDEQNNTQDDPQYRPRRVVGFYGNVRNVFSKVYKDFDTTKAFAYSQCWSTIAEAITKLNALPARRKYVIVYSDLQEHSSTFNAYRTNNTAATQPIATKLLTANPIPQKLQGITVLFVYLPQTRAEDTRFNQMLRVYKSKRAAGQQLRPAHDFVLATRYLYNTLNQVVQQRSPDGGTSTMLYDRLGRLVLSQNAKQQPGNKYSYTTYDILGRITEVGELTNSAAMNALKSKTPDQLTTWLSNAAATKTQVTATVYDEAYTPLNGLVLTAHNLRNRVSYTRVFASASDLSQGKHASATFYSYDIHGNADTVVQDFTIASLPSGSNRFWKKIVYQYDLISGKINQVAYQPGQPDAFYQRYTYNADNLLTNAESSTDSIYWENEAFYRYYAHGPLARTVIGQQQVQGVDYAYTLQGMA